MATIQETRGCISLVGETIDKLAADAIAVLKQETPDLQVQTAPFHITLVTKAEKRLLSASALAAAAELTTSTAATGPLHALGTAFIKRSGIAFIVVVWAAGQQIRKRLGLPPKDFHITLSAADDHGIDKSITRLRAGQFDANEASLECLDHLVFTLYNAGAYADAKRYALEMLRKDAHSPRGWLRLADAAFQGGEGKLAMLAYARAWERGGSEKAGAHALRMLRRCAAGTEWGALLRDDELAQLGGVAEATAALLLAPWSEALREAVAGMPAAPARCVEPRLQLHVPPCDGRLPRFFSWLVPFKLAVMSTPCSARDIEMLAAPGIGIRTVITLTAEGPLDPAWFAAGVTNELVPVRNNCAPSIEQMDAAMSILTDKGRLPVLVHCGGGKGRAGTTAACYLAACGFAPPPCNSTTTPWQPAMSAAAAIAALRARRPGSIETTVQESFVATYASALWKRGSLFPAAIPSPPSSTAATPRALLRFPRTPHILDLGSVGGDDEVVHGGAPAVPPGCSVIITEKVDGANVGFSLDPNGSLVVQNRSHYVRAAEETTGQFRGLAAWLAAHGAGLQTALRGDGGDAQRYVLYGEWLAATHSVAYRALPDEFLGFDVWDRAAGRFADRAGVEVMLRVAGLWGCLLWRAGGRCRGRRS